MEIEPDAPFDRAFTVPDANALILELEQAFEALDVHHRELERNLDQIQILDVLWGKALSDPENPDRGEFVAARAAVRDTLHRIDGLVSARITPLGVRLPPGGLDHGLVDFPSTLDGRWVFLCWKRGEHRVSNWHELGGGFAGRHRLTDEESERMGVRVPDGPEDS